VAGVRGDGEALVRPAVDRGRGADRAAGAGRGGDGVGLEGEAGGRSEERRVGGEWIAGDRADRDVVHNHVGDDVAGVGGDGVGLEGEAGGDGVARRYVGEGVAGDRAGGEVVHLCVGDDVAGVRGDGEALVRPAVDRGRGADRAAGAGRGGDGVGLEGEAGG